MKEKFNEKIMYTSYKRNSKWLGIIDYKSLCIILVYIWLVISLIEVVSLDLEKSLYIFLFLTVPVISVMFININNESTVNVIFYIIMFRVKKGIYVDKCFFKMNNSRYR